MKNKTRSALSRLIKLAKKEFISYLKYKNFQQKCRDRIGYNYLWAQTVNGEIDFY